jgi:hypothetical protein
MNALTKARAPAMPSAKQAAGAGRRAAPPGTIVLGANEYGGAIRMALSKLLEGRLMVQGLSGAGKSWTLRRILEQSASYHPAGRSSTSEGEFKSLAEELGHLHVDASKLDAASMAELGARIRAKRVSVVLDFFELEREQQLISLTRLMRAMMDVEKAHWHPCLVAIDECHLFAPRGSQDNLAPAVVKASVGAIVDMMSRGRKRGLLGMIASVRLSRLAPSVRSEAHNMLIGMNSLDVDIRRAAEMIGWDARKAFDRLPALTPGQFVVSGTAFSQSPAVVTVGSVKSKHTGATPELTALGSSANARGDLGLQELLEASAEAAAELDENRLGAVGRGRARVRAQRGLRACRCGVRRAEGVGARRHDTQRARGRAQDHRRPRRGGRGTPRAARHRRVERRRGCGAHRS